LQESLHWDFKTLHEWNVTHYLDDFLFVFPPDIDITAISVQFDKVLADFGLTKANEKDAAWVKNKLKMLTQGAKSDVVIAKMATTFIALCKAEGWPVEDYRLLRHPCQHLECVLSVFGLLHLEAFGSKELDHRVSNVWIVLHDENCRAGP